MKFVRPSILSALAFSFSCLIASGHAAHATDYNVTWDPTDATTNIKNTLSSTPAGTAGAVNRIILAYHSTPWYVSSTMHMLKDYQELVIQGDPVTGAPGKIIATDGGLKGVQGWMFDIYGNHCTINSYANGTDASGGIAGIEMRKNDYTNSGYVPPAGTPAYTGPYYADSEQRCGIAIMACDTISVKGVSLKNCGGDGILINGEYVWTGTNRGYASNVTITDVVCDGSLRDGISVQNVDSATISNSVFRNSSGKAPQAGVDIEPAFAGTVLTYRCNHVLFDGCTFSDNAGNNVQIDLEWLGQSRAPSSPLNPIGITFNNCWITGGSGSGIQLTSLPTDATSSGGITFTDCTVQNPRTRGLWLINWCGNLFPTTFQHLVLHNCGSTFGTPMEASYNVWMQSTASMTGAYGNLNFTTNAAGARCRIEDTNSTGTTNHSQFVGADATTKTLGLKNITGSIDISRSPSGSPLNLGTTPPNTNVTLSTTVVP